MADAGSFPLEADGSNSPERARLLRQIAAALDLPIEALAARLSLCNPTGPSAEECAAVLDAFARIEDPQLRAFCLQVLEGFTRR
jgi:hypothetical protein